MTRRIVSVSGPPGAGKSTLVQGLAREMGGTVVAYDDFEVITSWPSEKVMAWLDDGAPFDKVIAPRLRDYLEAQSGLIFFETPFGKPCPDTGGMITTSIWLECPDDVALARKIGALAAHNQGNEAFSAMILGWLQAYEAFTRRALAVQREKVKPTADFEVFAEKSASAVLSSTILHLNRYE